MKYSVEITIDLSRTRVIELFDNPDNLKEWQPGLISFENISGDPGKVGTKSKLLYKIGKREIEMIETITVNNLPDEFSGTFKAKGVYNEVRNYFHESGENQTLWVSENLFETKGFMRLLVFFMPGSFKKQSYKYLEYFKEFAEKQGN